MKFVLLFLLPICVIIILCVTGFKSCTHSVDVASNMSKDASLAQEKAYKQALDRIEQNSNKTLQSMKENCEKAIESARQIERIRYDALISDAQKNVIFIYCILIGSFLSAIVLFFNLVFALTSLSCNAILHPNKYETVLKEDAEGMRYLKSRLLERNVIDSNNILTKPICDKLLSGEDFKNT